MNKNKNRFFFGTQDYELLEMINQVLSRLKQKREGGETLAPGLHPHGIKELALSYDRRVAYAVIHLLDSLEAGEAEDRLLALRALHDEVLYGTMTNFRYNTGRVLVQLMKEIVRAYGHPDAQLRLAHDFRTAVSGRRRVVRRFMRRFHLYEMPESMDQLSFDNHVHDASTKGRKSATHLVMDAWIKGIRNLTVIYYNFVRPESARELMRAAKIMDIRVRLGVEYKVRFRGRYVGVIWQPMHFAGSTEMMAFLNEDATRALMRRGKAANDYYTAYVFRLLTRYNDKLRRDMSREFGVEFPPVTREEFLHFVGEGQPSVTHLADLLYAHTLPALVERHEELRARLAHASPEETTEEAAGLRGQMEKIQSLDAGEIQDTWLGPQYNTDLSGPYNPGETGEEPEIMLMSVSQLVDMLTGIRHSSQITLDLAGLRPADVLEILYECRGKITHIELFNLKNFLSGDELDLQGVNTLQLAINRGSSLILKRLILTMLRQEEERESSPGRAEKLREILYNIERLHGFYRLRKLGSSIGSDSSGRASGKQGMGFACLDTLPYRTQIALIRENNEEGGRRIVPLFAQADAVITRTSPENEESGTMLPRLLRRLPGLHFFGYARHKDWILRSERLRFRPQGNIVGLGGARGEFQAAWTPAQTARGAGSPWDYLNNSLLNGLKIAVGFVAAMLTFLHTQDWMVMMLLGAPIWFAVTGLRNIIQAVLGVGGLRRSPMLRWNNIVSWSRLSDSLLYTGLSVPLLELATRVWILQDGFGVNPGTQPWIFYTVMSVVNGLYIVSHNIFRGFPTSAVVGNVFRGALSIPVAVVYNHLVGLALLRLAGPLALPLLAQLSSITSKLASDSVAGIIEGLADRGVNLQARYFDYREKLSQLFNGFSNLALLLPEQDSILGLLSTPPADEETGRPENGAGAASGPIREMEKRLILDCLDLMYFWMYLPRARPMLNTMIRHMNSAELRILRGTQHILRREKEVSLLLLNGMVGKNFAKALSFYLGQYKNYLRDMERLCDAELKNKNADW